MKLIALSLIFIESFYPITGTVQNQNFISFENGTGYYSETEINIKQGEKVIVIGDKIYQYNK